MQKLWPTSAGNHPTAPRHFRHPSTTANHDFLTNSTVSTDDLAGRPLELPKFPAVFPSRGAHNTDGSRRGRLGTRALRRNEGRRRTAVVAARSPAADVRRGSRTWGRITFRR